MKKLPTLIQWSSFIWGFMLAYSASVSASIYDDLTADQKRQIRKGEMLVWTEGVPGSGWPRVKIVQSFSATAEEAAAIYFDYELQPTYFSPITQAKITKIVNPRVKVVNYTIHFSIPWFKDEHYSTENSVKSYEADSLGLGYVMEGHLIQADTVQKADGLLKFENFGTGAIGYFESYAVPGPGIPPMFQGQLVDQAKELTRAFIRQVQREKLKQQDLLQSQIETLRAALSEGN